MSARFQMKCGNAVCYACVSLPLRSERLNAASILPVIVTNRWRIADIKGYDYDICIFE